MSRYLDMVDHPSHVKKLTVDQLSELAVEIRHELIEGLAKHGGHLGPNLGVVELSIALHRCFETPRDRFVWDVSHQVYVHKLLTGRKDRFRTIRTTGGLNGFALRTESEHDCYGAGHAGTALSAALGIAATALFAFVGSAAWQAAAWLFVAANFGFGTSILFYESLLPGLARGLC